MPQASELLEWETLTEAVNEMKAPNNFLMRTLFGRSRPVRTRRINLSVLRRGRKIAPFVARDGAALLSDGRSEEHFSVEPPHIRTKKAMSPTELLSKRRAGTTIFPTEQAQEAAMAEYMASEFETLMDDVMNSEEWLAANILRGQVSYTSQDEVAFTVTLPRDASHNITLTGGDLWDSGTQKIRRDFLTAMQLVNDAVSLNVTDVILGEDAAEALLDDSEVRSILDVRRMRTGQIDLTQQMDPETGALFLGEYVHGIRIWRYARTVEVNGVSEPLIRPDYAEFVANSPAAQFVTYYGAIEDMDAIGDEGQVLVSPRFSKSWIEKDPSRRMLLVESNPLPYLRRPEATVSMKVV